MNRLIALFFISTFFFTSAFAQPLNTATPQVMLKTAQEQLEKQDAFRALEWFDKYYDETKDVEVIPQMARLSMELGDYKKAESYFSRYLKPKPNKKKKKELTEEQVEDFYNYGRSKKMNEKYEEAIVELEKYIARGKDPIKKELAQSEIDGAKLAIERGVSIADSKEVAGLKIEPIKKINSKEAEYGPFLYDNELYYASFGDIEEVITTDGETPMAYAQIYKSSKKKEKWGAGEPLDSKINREDFQTTHPHISPDGEYLFFTRSLMKGNVAEISKIYYSKKKGNDWAAPNEVAIGFDEQEFKAFHPSVGELFGKEVLFFVSDMDGGEGGRDLYYATKKGEGVYGEPVNIGSINTAGNEATPFYRNGTLYFSSNGLSGFGGYDLFTTVWNGTRWSKPENMGKGYNSPLDEKSFFLDDTGLNGFFTSNRSGKGIGVSSCYDVYSIVIPPVTANVLAEVFVGKKALKGASVALLEMVNESPTNPTEQSNKKANNFDFPLGLEKTYMLIASREGYMSDTAMVTTLDLKTTTTFNERFQLKKLAPVAPPPPPPAAEPEYEEISVEINKPIVLSNIYYDLDDDKILQDAEKDLSVLLDLMQRYPEMVIQLSSHTDFRGGNDYNQALSQRRAESAARWLVERGIASERIQSVGYGEQQPATVTADQAIDNPGLEEGWVLTLDLITKLSPKQNRENAHQVNRRTEFSIIKGPTNIKIKKLEKRIKKQPKVIIKNSKKKPTKKKSKRRNANPIGDIMTKEGPKMVFEYSEIDFGPVKKGEKREHTFEFVNKGDEDLIIELVTACQCTTLDYSTEPVKPGETGKIHAIFDSSEKEGGEKIDIDIILENIDPETGYQIVERVSYTFEIEE